MDIVADILDAIALAVHEHLPSFLKEFVFTKELLQIAPKTIYTLKSSWQCDSCRLHFTDINRHGLNIQIAYVEHTAQKEYVLYISGHKPIGRSPYILMHIVDINDPLMSANASIAVDKVLNEVIVCKSP